MFDMTMTEEQANQFRQQLADAVKDRVNGEQLVAAGAFRRGGAAGSYAASKLGGGLAYGAMALARKKKSGGLPQQVLLAVTTDNLYAFKCKVGARATRPVTRSPSGSAPDSASKPRRRWA